MTAFEKEKNGMKKIAFHLNCLARAGAERVVTNLSAQFAAEGYEVVIATEWREKEEYELDSRVCRVIVEIGRASCRERV